MNELNSINSTLNTEFDELIRAIFYVDKNFDRLLFQELLKVLTKFAFAI